jgi:hypothetical protein
MAKPLSPVADSSHPTGCGRDLAGQRCPRHPAGDRVGQPAGHGEHDVLGDAPLELDLIEAEVGEPGDEPVDEDLRGSRLSQKGGGSAQFEAGEVARLAPAPEDVHELHRAAAVAGVEQGQSPRVALVVVETGGAVLEEVDVGAGPRPPP